MMWFKRLSNWFSNQVIKLSLVIIVLASSWALFRPGLFRVHDFTHAARISELSRALADGHFPVRWSSNLGYGYGMPLFNYYAPLPYYVGAVFYGLGVDVITTIKILYLICTILTAWGAFQLGKDWFGKWGGVLGAAALTLAPYRAVNLFVRGALSEAWAIAFLPIIIWAMGRVIKKQQRAWPWLVFSLTGLFLSHNITTMLFVPIGGLIALALLVVELLTTKPKMTFSELFRVITNLFTASLMSLGLAAFYLLPAFLEKDLTQYKATILSGYFDYRLHFLYIRQFLDPTWKYGGSGWGPNDGISFFLGFGQLAALLIVIFISLKTNLQNFSVNHKFNLRKSDWLSLVAIGVVLISLFMSLEKASFFWQKINLLAFAQFPWRWLSIGVTGLSLVVASVSNVLPKVWWRNSLLMTIWLVIVVGNMSDFRPETYLAQPEGLFYTDPIKIQTSMSEILPDYIPLQMHDSQVPPKTLWLNSDLSAKNVEVMVNRTQEKLLKISTSQTLNFQLAVADFPSWTLELDGLKAIKTQGKLGNVSLTVPPGTHTVGLIWTGTPIEQWSNWISLISAIIILGLGIYQTQSSNRTALKSNL